MIKIIAVLCNLASPANCHEQIVTTSDFAAVSMQSCLMGAPQLEHVETNVPEFLSRQFVVAVTLTALPCWALLGGLTGFFYHRFSRAVDIRPAHLPSA